MKQITYLAALLAAVCCAPPGGAAVRPLVPYPVSVREAASQVFPVTQNTVISYDASLPGAKETAEYAAKTLAPAMGFTLKTQPGARAKGIVFKKASQPMPPETYTLKITPEAAVVTASDRAGAFYGVQTIRQLLPVEIYGQEKAEAKWELPCVEIEDSPRFKWRGVHFDVCRHFFPKEVAKDLLDTMAAHKLNTLHWHLTDDQGWRIEIKKHPKLTEIGGYRLNSVTRWNRNKPDGKPYGPYFFTQDDAREIVAYAANLNITVVPEIELPGHALAALSAYPELSCTGGPFTPRWLGGVEDDVFCAGNDATIKLLEDVFDEILEIFPSTFIHAGGDECPKVRWKKCPKCQKRIKDNNLKGENGLQSWMVQHFANYLKSKGRNLIGWDEILEGGLAKGAAVMSWRGTSGGIAAAKMGHEVVMVPNTYLYLDYGQMGKGDPYEYIGGMVTVPRVYSLDPTAGIPEEMQKFVIGVQGNNWTEYTRNREELEWKMWPRAAALAEVAWTPQSQRDLTRFMTGMQSEHMARLAKMGLNAAPLPAAPVAAWKPADVSTEWQEKSWNLGSAITGEGPWVVTFMYEKGSCRLDMKDAALLVNGKVIARDDHEGTTGGRHERNRYTLTLPPGSLPPGAAITLKAMIRADGGTDSYGGIFVEQIKR